MAGSSEWSLAQFQREFASWVDLYNHDRPHSALRGMPPVVYYLGEPDAATAEREHFVREAAAARATYWQQETKAKEGLQF